MDNCTRKRIRRILDVILLIGVTICIIITEYGNLNQFMKFGFQCRDPGISFKYRGETINNYELVFITISVPALVITSVEWLMACRLQSYSKATKLSPPWIKRVISTYATYFVGCLFLFLLITMLKSIISEPRPHFLDTCKPLEAVNCTPGVYFLDFTCTSKGTKLYLKDSTKSFPSGHAALTTYCSIFLIGYLNRRFTRASRTILTLLQFSLLFLMIFVSVSRITDRRHHWWDVSIGIAIGAIFSIYKVCKLQKTFATNVPKASLFDETDLNRHLEVNHSKNRNFVCNLTDETFINK